MAYSVESFRKVKNELEERRRRARAEADMHRAELALRAPEAAKVDEALQKTGMRLFRIACNGGDGMRDALSRLREENEALLSRRRALLAECGLPEDYTEVHYVCPVCNDTGYGTDGAMCACMKKLLAEEEIRQSGIGALVDRQSFETYSLQAASPTLKKTYEICKNYADTFLPEKAGDLLLSGPTGLGKTHLSTAIAKTVIEKGYCVVYESMLTVMEAFQHDRFHATEKPVAGKYLDAELLILDDVGAELPGAFATAVLYQLINTRQNRRLPTVISTNLSAAELTSRYDARIGSRLLGGYRICVFDGADKRIDF